MSLSIVFDNRTFEVSSNAAATPEELAIPGYEDLAIYRLPAGDTRVKHALEDPEFYRHGWNSWSPTAWRKLSDYPWRVWNNPGRSRTAEDPITDAVDTHRGYQVGALSFADSKVMLLGSLSRGGALVEADSRAMRGIVPTSAGPFNIEGGSSAEGEPWVLILGDELRAFEAYGKLLADALDVAPRASQKIAQRGAAPVWSSWYSWFEEITQEIISAEISHAAKAGYSVLEIDDGWEESVGTWEPNADFPDLPGLARQIREAGLRPGIWVSPFIAKADSYLVRNHPDWLVKEPDSDEPIDAGFNWGTRLYALDTTHPQALEWVKDIFTELRSWGFDYFKTDFIYAAAMPGRRYADVPREEAYMRGIQAIRDAVGEDAYLLGSGGLPAASLGILDGMRMGPDTAPYWDNMDRYRDPSGPAVANALRNSLSRFWWKPWIDTDPDVALVRTRGSLLSPEVNRLTLDAAIACGTFGCSDPGQWLTDTERSVLMDAISDAKKEAEGELAITQTGRYTFTIGERVVDFDQWLNPKGRISDRLLVK
ncbi:MAG: alpha-galactosidase [Actinomycetaceae bacterium]|nr:alpha-galactosidase [Actinomycetaceae bacterium]